MPGPIDRLQELFHRALDYSDPGERSRYLQQACADDPELRRRVERLLDAHEAAGDFLSENPLNEEASLLPGKEASIHEGPGAIVGRYKLLEQIGEGGMGVVYMAEQLEPVRRRVAVKIIKLGMDTRQVVARFEAERQALALMDHPGIAKVLDAGATESGRPFFVMDLVRGEPITRFCQQSQLALRERLDLFKQVCQAVQHAHQKGIIHRDLKPSNILVTLDYGQPTPRIIDFGVAKATNQRLTEKTLFTQFSVMIGTPAYMSPEQAEMTSLDVDTRTDIYSLGVLLYELLTDTTPFAEEKLRSAGYDEMRRIIREEQPERPSTRLKQRRSARHSAPAGTPANLPLVRSRPAQEGKSKSEIDKDLDWIVMKCLEKDQRRRYETANGLAMDVERYLTYQPVVARPTSRLYAFQKTVRRHKVGFAAASAIGLSVVLGAIVSTWEAVRAREHAATAEAVLRFVQEDLLGQADPFGGGPQASPDRTLTLLEAIERTSKGLETRYEDQPLVEASIRHTIGKAYRRLGEHEAAKTHLRTAYDLFEQEVGREDLRSLATLQELAWLIADKSGYEEAARISREVLAMREAKLGPTHPSTLDSLQCLGTSHMWMDDFDEAIHIFEEVRDRARRASPPNHVAALEAMHSLVWAKYLVDGFSPEVIQLNRENLRQATEALGPNHPIILKMAQRAVGSFSTAGLLNEAERVGREAVAGFQQGFSPGNTDFLLLKDVMVDLEAKKGLNKEGPFRELVDLSCEYLGSNNIYTLYLQGRLGQAVGFSGRFQDSERMLRECLLRIADVEGPDSPEVRRILPGLSEILLLDGKFDECEKVKRRAAELASRFLGEESRVTRYLRTHLANLFARQGRWGEAVHWFHTAETGKYKDEFSVVPALLAAALARDPEGLHTFGTEAANTLPVMDAPMKAFDFARALLLTVDRVSGIESAQTIQASENAFGLQKAPITQTVLSALIAWRKEDWTTAGSAAETLVKQANGRYASLGGFILAMAAFRQGDSNQARLFLQTAHGRLDRVLRSGDLGEQWAIIAPAIIAGEAASDLIYGKRVAPTIDSNTLAHAREAWQPLRHLLEQAGWAARKQEWDKALDGYRQAIAHPQFSWEAALLQDPCLNFKLASLLVLTGQTNEYVAFCREALLPDKALYLLPGFPDGEIAQSGLLAAQRSVEAIPSDQKSAENRHWKELTLAMAQYRKGNYAEALQLLKRARGAFNLNCSGTAAAFGAMAAQRARSGEQAKTLLAQAEEAHRQLLERNADDLGPSWHDTAILQIALQEAHTALPAP